MSVARALDRELEEFFGVAPKRPRGRPRTKPRRVPGPTAVRDNNRDAQIVVMRESGTKLEEIGAVFGITRERVRQVLKRNGYSGPAASAVDPIGAMRLLRLRHTLSVEDAARALGVHSSQVYRLLHAMGRAESVARLLRWRRHSLARPALVAQLQAFAATHGRSPYMREFGLVRGSQRYSDLPDAGTLQRYFGSLPAAFEAAGLARRTPGGGGHRRKQVAV